MFEINSMTLTITGRIGVTTLQITRERSVKNMDWIITLGAITAFATSMGAIISYIKYRYDKGKDVPYIATHCGDSQCVDEWLLIEITFYPNDSIISYTSIKTKEPIISDAINHWPGGKFSPILAHSDGLSSLPLSVIVPPNSVSTEPAVKFLYIKRSRTNSLKTLIVEYKRPHAIFKTTTTVTVETHVNTKEMDFIVS